MTKKRIFLDMDGVLAEYKADASVEDMKVAGYFKNLAPREQMIEAVKYLLSMKGFDVFILSAVLLLYNEPPLNLSCGIKKRLIVR